MSEEKRERSQLVVDVGKELKDAIEAAAGAELKTVSQYVREKLIVALFDAGRIRHI